MLRIALLAALAASAATRGCLHSSDACSLSGPQPPLAHSLLQRKSRLLEQAHHARAGDDPVSDKATEQSEDAGSLPFFDLVILVPSHGRDDAKGRQAIRTSWAQYTNSSVANCTPCQNWTTKLVFVVGNEGDADLIGKEKREHDDVASLGDFNQSAATTASADAERTQRSIRYMLEHFKFRLLLKAHMSSWVFTDRLLDFLDGHRLFDVNATMPGVYAGHFADYVTSSKQRVRYADGAGYLLSPDLCEFIAGMGAASEDTSGAPSWGDEYGWAPVPRLLTLPEEDVSVGFWLQAVNHTKVDLPMVLRAERCNADPLHPPVVERLSSLDEMRAEWESPYNAMDRILDSFPCALTIVQPEQAKSSAGGLLAACPLLASAVVVTSGLAQLASL